MNYCTVHPGAFLEYSLLLTDRSSFFDEYHSCAKVLLNNGYHLLIAARMSPYHAYSGCVASHPYGPYSEDYIKEIFSASCFCALDKYPTFVYKCELVSIYTTKFSSSKPQKAFYV